MTPWQMTDEGVRCWHNAYEALIQVTGQPGVWMARIKGPGGFWKARMCTSQAEALRWCERQLRVAGGHEGVPYAEVDVHGFW